jgi:hypothetical protein
MRLCEHLHVQRQGARLNFSPGKARWASFRVLEPHVTATKIHRATRVVARVWHLFARSFDCTKASICRGDGACRCLHRG